MAEQFDYAAQFAADQSTELPLPSGKVVRVKTPDVLQMAMEGLIPDNLTPLVERFIFDKEQTLAKVNAEQKPPGERIKDYADYLRYVDVVVVGACVAPVVRFKPKAGEISPDRISTPDRIAIWSWAEGLTGALSTFPEDGGGADAGLSALADGEEPQPTAERADSAGRAD